MLDFGMAKNHKTTPAASLRIHNMLPSPKLFSGLASILINKKEMEILNIHYRKKLRRLQHLPASTAIPAIYLLSGSLPAEAVLHVRQFTLLHMIALLGPSNPLCSIALQNLKSPPMVSWFGALRKVATRYVMPDPLQIIVDPPSKTSFRRLVRSKILTYWSIRTRRNAAKKGSHDLLKISHLPLGRGPHPLWTSCTSPTQTRSATLIAKMLTGTYSSCHHIRHWKHTNGSCRLPGCGAPIGDVLHMFTTCKFLQTTLIDAADKAFAHLKDSPQLGDICLRRWNSSPETRVKFLLDPTTDPEIIQLHQLKFPYLHNKLFQSSRNIVWAIHKARLRGLGLPQFI